MAALQLGGQAMADKTRAAPILKRDGFRAHVEAFAKDDDGRLPTHIGNDAAWAWIRRNVPFFECPHKQIEQIYYFRWWTFRKHVKKTPDGFIITEFLPRVGWAGKHNSISCAAGHHFREGRWLRDGRYLDDYAVFWFRKGGEPRRYSFWAADSIWARYLVDGRAKLPVDLLPDLIRNFKAWEASKRDASRLFRQIDDRDGMEYSIGGSGYRPTINSYMYGDAVAIANLAELAGRDDLAREYRAKAAEIKKLVQTRLWDAEAKFFKTRPAKGKNPRLVDVREEVGFVPWYFNLPDPGHEAAWKQLLTPHGFRAPFGPTTAEQRHPRFMEGHGHDCLWNGPSWPYATTQTLVALANLLNHYEQKVITRRDYLDLLATYAKWQYRRGQPWIAENLDGRTGRWIVDKPRSVYYNHSGYCDLVITGLVGLRPRKDDRIEVNPLVPEGTWDWFCLDGVRYRGRDVSILYDKTGKRYGRGKGLRVLADGREIASSPALGRRIVARLPAPVGGVRRAEPKAAAAPDTRAGWAKHGGNPVLGGKLGTCFDLSVLKEGATFRMWFSWRPKKSLALVESPDGVRWGRPRIVLAPNRRTDWEADINRPVVLKRGGQYHMWYTGQARDHSWIGYATSPDGVAWTRASDKPVLAPDGPWEKVAVMCPHVLWNAGKKRYRMWYSGGEQYEPDAIGCATSPDGRTWTKHPANPVFRADANNAWERHKVAACQVLRRGRWHYMFYIGFRDEHHAQIGLARSRDGLTAWQRHPDNPIIRPGSGWDRDAVYKPFALLDGRRWMLWYNGRREHSEQIGLVTHEGEDLGFGP
jgi:predicted GH43/DUF377 family glycosyl hydrolase